MKLHLLLMAALILVLSACSTTGGDKTAATNGGDEIWREYTADDATKAITSAEAAIKLAASVDGEWRDTSKVYLNQAKDAASNGIYKIAVQMAESAQFQAEMGYQQAMSQKDAKPWLF